MITPDFTLIHLSDPHIMPAGQTLHGIDTSMTFQDSLDRISESNVQPDAIAITGDLSDAGDVAAYARFRATVDAIERRFGVPVAITLGNHDQREGFREGYLGEVPSAAPYHHAMTVKGVRLIALDSSVAGAIEGWIDAEQMDWLGDQLAMPADRGTILLLHHAPVPAGHCRGDIASRLVNADELADVVLGSDVIGLLAGHVHQPTTAVFAGVPCHSAGSTAYTLDPMTVLEPGAATMRLRGLDGPSFSLVQVYDRTMVATAVTLPSAGREVSRHEFTAESLAKYDVRIPAGVR